MLAYVRLNQKKYDKLGGWHIYIYMTKLEWTSRSITIYFF
jgi:hypothetical protein